MSEEKTYRVRPVVSELNIGLVSLVEFLKSKGHTVENSPMAKITEEQYQLLRKEFAQSAEEKKTAHEKVIGRAAHENTVVAGGAPAAAPAEQDTYIPPSKLAPVTKDTPKTTASAPVEAKPATEKVSTSSETGGLKVLGKIELDSKGRPIPPKPASAPEPKPEPAKEIIPPSPEVEQVTATAPAVPAAEVSAPAQEEVKEAKPEVAQSQADVAPAVPVANEAPVVSEAPATPAEPSVVAEQTAPKAENPQPSEETASPVTPAIPEVKPSVAQSPASREAKPAPKPQSGPQGPKGNGPAPTNKPNKGQDHNNGNKGQGKRSDQPIKPAEWSPKIESEKVAAQAAVVADATTTAPTGETSDEVIRAAADQLKGLTVLGKIQLPVDKPKTKPGQKGNDDPKRQRKRVKVGGGAVDKIPGAVKIEDNSRPKGPGGGPGGNRPGKPGDNRNNNRNDRNNRGGAPGADKPKEEISQKEIQDQIKATMARMAGQRGGNLGGRSKIRRDNRNARSNEGDFEQENTQILKVTEFISVADLASLMDVSVNEVISSCLKNGRFVSINQRLDAEIIEFIALEFGFETQFISAEEELKVIDEEPDNDEDLTPRAPIVTIMGHVDHGKTSLLDYIRKSRVAEGEAGGITQHIGAYDVTTESGKRIAFLDTPGHEAFTAMRARGAKVTDVVIIVVAADDEVMPQTKEAINHAQAAGVPMVFAINKIDKPGANSERIREQLAQMNILVEDWGGKYQCQEISAKKGIGISELLEKVLLEAELLELKANPNRKAIGTVIEAMLDKGRGYVTTVLIQNGTLKIGDIMLVGQYFGRVKAMTDHTGKRLKVAGPSTPVQVLGLDGSPQSGDKLQIMETEREAREIANKREQILREQSIRTRKHLTLDEIARRRAVGNFKELNLIVKGDVDGSVEALSDSLQKLSTDEIAVNIIYKAVGQVSESDVLLASASDAVIIGFQVRPSLSARKMAEHEEIEIRTYSIIYDAINEVKAAMEGLLAPTQEEIVSGIAEVREVFRISKVGSVAGCMIVDGTFKRNNKVRVLRNGMMIYTGDVDALKRFKDDTNEVRQGFECGISIKNFNDFKEGDLFESVEIREIKRTLKD